MRRGKKHSPTLWRVSPEGSRAYTETRAQAQAEANADGFDRGVEANDLFRTWRHFRLPATQYRQGYELRCEVVSCEDWEKCQPGHGPISRGRP